MSGNPQADQSLSLVVPVYRTADLVAALVRDLPSLAAAASASGCRLVEAIIVDDGSPNGAEIAAAARAGAGAPCPVRLIRYEPNRGKGHAVRTGALAATGGLVLMSDADRSAPLAEAAKLIAALTPETWIACGSRCQLGAFGRHVPLRRRLLSFVFNVLTRLAGVKGIQDTQCGFKLFRMAEMRPIFSTQKVERFAFDVELIARARAAGGLVAEVPVDWRGSGRTTLRIPLDGPRMLWDLCRLAFGRR